VKALSAETRFYKEKGRKNIEVPIQAATVQMIPQLGLESRAPGLHFVVGDTSNNGVHNLLARVYAGGALPTAGLKIQVKIFSSSALSRKPIQQRPPQFLGRGSILQCFPTMNLKLSNLWAVGVHLSFFSSCASQIII